MTRLGRARIIIASCSLSYLSVGIASGALGPLLPELAARSGVTLSEVGLLFSFYFLGGVLARMSAGNLSDRYGEVPVVVGGLTLEVLSAVSFTLSRSAAALYASSFLLGASSGSALLGAVLIAARLFPERGVVSVNFVNVFWGVGSFVGPALFSGASSALHTGIPVVWVSGAMGVVSTILLLGAGSRVRPRPAGSAAVTSGGAIAGQTLVRGDSVLLVLPFWLFGLMLLFEIGVESTIGGWTAVYLERSTSISLQNAALVVSGFYLAFTAGRMFAAGAGTRLPAWSVLSGGLMLAFLGMGIVSIAPGHVVPSVVGFLLAGLGVGPIYPTVTALITSGFGNHAGMAVGLTGSIGFVGGLLFPWIGGLLMPSLGGVAAMRLVLLLILLVAFFAYLVHRTVTRAVTSRG